MFELKYILVIILLGILIYLVYNLYSFQVKKIDQFKENFEEKIDVEFEDLNEKLCEIEELVQKRFNGCDKKIRDLYSLQNKLNEINKMNGQSIINQINQYDEIPDDVGENRDQIFNSVENSSVNKQGNFPNQNNTKNNSSCFVKLNQLKPNDKEFFYMSPENKKKSYDEQMYSDNNSKTSKNTISVKSANTDDFVANISKKHNKVNKSDFNSNSNSNSDSDSDSNGIVLEINDAFVKTSCDMETSLKATRARNSLNNLSNLIKNNSMGKFNSHDDNQTDKSKNKSYLTESIGLKVDSDIDNKLKSESGTGTGTEIESNSNSNSNSDSDSDSDSSENSNNLFQEHDTQSGNITNESDDIMLENDPPLLHPEIINKINYMSKNGKKTNKIINIK